MTRIAGNNSGYRFRLVRHDGSVTENGFDLPSVTTIIGDTLAKAPGAMSWYGYRIGMKGVHEALLDDPQPIIDAETPELLEKALKERGVSPNLSLEKAGSRGSAAHDVLELIANGERERAVDLADQETGVHGTEYGLAAVSWWDEMVQPFIESGEILQVRSEMPVWSLINRYCGTLDLAIEWDTTDVGDHIIKRGWEILDAKTHKPARGFTLPGKGAGYISDAVQCRAYRMAFEEMGLGRTWGQRTIVLRENGQYLEDKREVSEDFVLDLRRLYDERNDFEGGK